MSNEVSPLMRIEDTVKAIALFAFTRGNWQKPVTPEDLQSYIDCILDMVLDTSNVTRLEVIDHTKPVEEGGGRILVRNDVSITYAIQDEGRTLKVFINRISETTSEVARHKRVVY